MNKTLPVGVPSAEEIVAVKITDCPKNEGFCDEVNEVEVSAYLYTVPLLLEPPNGVVP